MKVPDVRQAKGSRRLDGNGQEPASANETLVIDGVKKWYRSRRGGEWLCALRGVSLTVRDGEFVAVIGTSGCGKTTLLRVMAGLIAAEEGRVLFEGREVRGVPQAVSFVFQDPALLMWETVSRNVELGLGRQKMPAASRRSLVREHLELIGLEKFASYYPYQISGGMQQRVGLARALIGDPHLLLLDEPLGALDAFTRVRLQEELLQLVGQRHRTTVLVTHDIEEALFLADRIVVMGVGSVRAIEHVPCRPPVSRLHFLAIPEIVALKERLLSAIEG